MNVRTAVHSVLVTLLSLLFLGSAGPSFAVTRNVPGDYAAIQDAIDASASGDVVLVAAGTYSEHIALKDGVVVQGAGAGISILDGGGAGTIVFAGSSVSGAARLSGFTLQNGEAGIVIIEGAPIVRDNEICFNGPWSGVATVTAAAQIIGNDIHHNSGGVSGGGGILCQGGDTSVFAENQITDNWTESASAGGGGVKILASSVTLQNNVIRRNYAGYAGGGVQSDFSTATMVGNTITDNVADFYGGGIEIGGAGDVVMDNLIEGNAVLGTPGGGGHGGGMHLTQRFYTGPGLRILRNTIRNNMAVTQGGGIYILSGPGENPFLVSGNIVEGNATTGGGQLGGGIMAFGPGVIRDNIIQGNTSAGSAGGVHLARGTHLINNLIAENLAAAGAGGLAVGLHPSFDPGNPDAVIANNVIVGNQGGVWLYDPGQDHFVNNTVANNAGYGLIVGGLSVPAYPIANHILWGNGCDLLSLTGQSVTTHCLVGSYEAGTLSGPGDVSVNPLFVDAAHGNYHLQPGSPAIDAGLSSAVPAQITTDFEDESRIFGAAVDIGADEFAAVVPALCALVDLVEHYYQQGSIDNEGIRQSLIAKLNAAKRKVKQEQYQAASNILQAFLSEVRAQRSRHIGVAEADTLIQRANAILDLL